MFRHLLKYGASARKREAAIGDRAFKCRVYVTIGDQEDFGANFAYREIALNGRRAAHLMALRQHSGVRIDLGALSAESHHFGSGRSLLDGLQALDATERAT